jgi:ATP-dependent DNA ligase
MRCEERNSMGLRRTTLPFAYTSRGFALRARGVAFALSSKRLDSQYEIGLRSGAWQKMRVNRGQEFVIGGYTVGSKTFDALVFGYYESDRLIYAARTRNGFTPVVREQLFKKFRGLDVKDCPFVNLPEAKSGRWGAGLTAAKMKDCRWLKPVLVAQIEFLEWTGETTCATPSSLRCATTNRHARFGASS